MAVMRDRPYTQFNFLVDLGTGDPDGPDGGFETVTGLETWVDVIEYRNGNSKENVPIKLTGLNRVSDVTLKRGLIGSLSLYQWFNDIRNGTPNALRNVTISLQNEDHTGDRHDVEAAARSHHQVLGAGLERQGQRRGDRGDRDQLRAPGDRVGVAIQRRDPYRSFNFRVAIGGRAAANDGFSAVRFPTLLDASGGCR